MHDPAENLCTFGVSFRNYVADESARSRQARQYDRLAPSRPSTA